MLDPQTFVNEIATKWCNKYPTQSDKIMRGAMLALSGKVEERSCASWRVEGSKGTSYLVELVCGYARCNCPDFKFHQKRYEESGKREKCYHAWACALLVRLQAEVQNELTPKTIDSFVEITVPLERISTPKKKVDGLGELCRKLHQQNHERAAKVEPCPVIELKARR